MQPEGKKFFLAPSLAVAEGDLTLSPLSQQFTQEYDDVSMVQERLNHFTRHGIYDA